MRDRHRGRESIVCLFVGLGESLDEVLSQTGSIVLFQCFDQYLGVQGYLLDDLD